MSLAQSGRANFCCDNRSRSVHFIAAGDITLLFLFIDDDKLFRVEASLEQGAPQVLSSVLSTVMVSRYQLSPQACWTSATSSTSILVLKLPLQQHLASAEVEIERLFAHETNSIKEGRSNMAAPGDCHAIRRSKETSARWSKSQKKPSDNLF